MTQEEISKIWIDLSARVMYHPNIQVTNTYLNETYDEVLTMANFTQFSDVKYEVKPYLRLIESMTEEEIDEFTQFDVYSGSEYIMPNYEVIDWLNANHFDYRGLIEKGLALEAPEGMYNKHVKAEQEQIEELAELKRRLNNNI